MWCCLQSFFSLCLACLGQMLRAVPNSTDIWILYGYPHIITHHCLKSSIMDIQISKISKISKIWISIIVPVQSWMSNHSLSFCGVVGEQLRLHFWSGILHRSCRLTEQHGPWCWVTRSLLCRSAVEHNICQCSDIAHIHTYIYII